MARKNRVSVPDGIYHVTVRIANRAMLLDDDEMIGRLRSLYGEKRADEIAETWALWRRNGFDHLVDERKERYCRRMYNLSQFVKTLKERIYGIMDAKWHSTGPIRRRS